MDDSGLGIDARGADVGYRLTAQAHSIEAAGSDAMVRHFLAPLLARLHLPAPACILDVGCGIGQTVRTLLELGYDAYGLEPGGRFDEIGHDLQQRIYQAYSNDFAEDGAYDLVMSHGVIEHVGTTDGHDDLAPDYRQQRRDFLRSLVRLAKPGAFVLVCCPNRLFPFDFQHGPHRYGILPQIRRSLGFLPGIERLALPWHPENYLCAFDEITELLEDGAVTPIRVRQGRYLALGTWNERPFARRLFRAYIATVNRLPARTWDYCHTHTIWLGQRQYSAIGL